MNPLIIALIVLFGNLNLFLLITGIVILILYVRMKKYLRARTTLVKGFVVSYSGDIFAVNDEEKLSE